MPNFLIDEETDLLAAEFVLGTLDAEERANARPLLRTDHGFIAMVRIWERRLGELHLMVEPVEPEAQILTRIKAKLPQASQGAPSSGASKPATAPEPEPASAEAPPGPPIQDQTITSATVDSPHAPEPAETPADVETPAPEAGIVGEGQTGPELRLPETAERSEQGSAEKAPVSVPESPPLPDKLPDPHLEKREEVAVDVTRSRGRWRAFSGILVLAVAALAALIAAWRFVPDRVPLALRPSQLMTLIGVAANQPPPQAPRPIPPAAQFDE